MGKVLTENKGNYFDESVRNIFEIILNDKLKKMYYWFHKIEIERIAYSSIDGQPYFAINGDIYVDEDWGGFQWREYQGQKPMTYPGDELSFGEIIGEDLSRELRDTFLKIIGAITGKTFKYTSFSWIDTHLVEPKNDLQEQRIIEEETKMNIRLRRRLGMLDYEVEHRLSVIYRADTICRYESGEELLDVVGDAAIDSMYWNYFANIDDNSAEWGEIYHNMVKYITDKYGEKIKNYYVENCSTNKGEMREEELTEKCWKGYTQKGMKTMFGKRYPNCVKKTKK
jgi:hypothetical protein